MHSCSYSLRDYRMRIEPMAVPLIQQRVSHPDNTRGLHIDPSLVQKRNQATFRTNPMTHGPVPLT